MIPSYLQDHFKTQSYDPNQFFLIAGPCVVESEALVMEIGERVSTICKNLGIPYVFKASYRKANRTSANSFTGIGDDNGLSLIKKVGQTFNLPTTSDIHAHDEAAMAAEFIDILQIPAFLCRQTDLLVAAAETGKVVNIKKGQFLSPYKVKNIIDKVVATGNKNILVTERGNSFGYDSLVSDMRSIQIMKEFGFPVIYDATHSAQIPGNFEETTSGNRQFIPGQIYSAIATGCDGIFMEVHDNVDQALSDASTQWPLEQLESVLVSMLAFRETYLNHGEKNG